MTRTLAVLALAAALLAGCTQFALVEPQKPVRLGDAYEIDPQVKWSRLSTGPRELWTIDGPLLNRVLFFNGLIGGDPLFEIKQDINEPRPLFRASMSPLEIRDFIVASLPREGFIDLTTQDMRPFDFGGDQGFRFDFSYATEDGLKNRGIAVGAVNRNRLYLIVYVAPEIHYFTQHRATFDRMLQSLRPRGTSA